MGSADMSRAGHKQRRKQQVRGYFDAEATRYVHERQQEHSFISQKRIVLEMLEGVRGRILEIGCGPGLMVGDLLERGLEYWGIDASAEMIRYARRRVAQSGLDQRVHLAVGDFEQLAYPDGCFDAVLCMGTLEYLPSYERGIGEMQRVLKPGGSAVINLPNRVCAYHLARAAYDAARALARQALGRHAAPGPEPNRCVPWRLDRQLARAGLRKLEGRSCNFIFFPLHELAPALSTALNRRLSWLSATPIGHWAGTQYNVRAVKENA
jgi:ubiquinone/menaquinone biosynthesis C-methylase UbiE